MSSHGDYCVGGLSSRVIRHAWLVDSAPAWLKTSLNGMQGLYAHIERQNDRLRNKQTRVK